MAHFIKRAKELTILQSNQLKCHQNSLININNSKNNKTQTEWTMDFTNWIENIETDVNSSESESYNVQIQLDVYKRIKMFNSSNDAMSLININILADLGIENLQDIIQIMNKSYKTQDDKLQTRDKKTLCVAKLTLALLFNTFGYNTNEIVNGIALLFKEKRLDYSKFNSLSPSQDHKNMENATTFYDKLSKSTVTSLCDLAMKAHLNSVEAVSAANNTIDDIKIKLLEAIHIVTFNSECLLNEICFQIFRRRRIVSTFNYVVSRSTSLLLPSTSETINKLELCLHGKKINIFRDHLRSMQQDLLSIIIPNRYILKDFQNMAILDIFLQTVLGFQAQNLRIAHDIFSFTDFCNYDSTSDILETIKQRSNKSISQGDLLMLSFWKELQSFIVYLYLINISFTGKYDSLIVGTYENNLNGVPDNKIVFFKGLYYSGIWRCKDWKSLILLKFKECLL